MIISTEDKKEMKDSLTVTKAGVNIKLGEDLPNVSILIEIGSCWQTKAVWSVCICVFV
jgi:hypothetical protein